MTDDRKRASAAELGQRLCRDLDVFQNRTLGPVTLAIMLDKLNFYYVILGSVKKNPDPFVFENAQLTPWA
jgi:hypothetical protein